MGPPQGHVRDPQKQKRFTEAELSALLQAAGGTLPVIKKNEKGVYVIVEAEGAAHGHAAPAAKPAAPAAAKPPAVTEKSTPDAAHAASIAEKSMTPPAPAPKAAAEPNRSLNRRSTYAGVVDTGPVAGETNEQKIERLKKVVAGAKQRAEQGGGEHVSVVDSSPSADAHRPAAEAQAETGAASAAPLSVPAATASPVAGAETPAELAPDQVAPATTPTPTTASSAEPDRNLMKRSTYAGVLDTGPIEGETDEQKIERLTKLVAGAKQKAEGGG